MMSHSGFVLALLQSGLRCDDSQTQSNLSGMNRHDYRTGLIAFIERNALPPDKCSHQARLYALATRLAGASPFDNDVVFAAAWLHDLGVFIGHRPEDPHQLGRWD